MQHLKTILLAAAMMLCVQVQRLNAVPAYPGTLKLVQPDGTSLSVRLHGDEHFHWYATADGYLLTQQADGFFHYARIEKDRLASTGVRASDPARRTGAEKALLATLDKRTLSAQTADLYKKIRRAGKLKMPNTKSYPTTGARRTVAILVDFPQTATRPEPIEFYFDNPQQLFSDMLNERGFNRHNATGSVADYFHDASNGRFDLTFDVFGPVTMDNDVSFYGDNEEAGTWQMVVEACRKLDDQIDFSEYDQDKDGVIDNVYVFYAGQGEADGGPRYTIWPHAGDLDELTSESFSFDGVKLNHYACSNEIAIRVNPVTEKREKQLAGIGTICHEFTHVLGFPDLYNTLNQAASFTPGSWSLMDIGSYNNDSHTPPTFSAYERMCMGWLDPTDLNERADVILEPLSSNKAYRILTPNSNEMFILENRQQEGWDEYLPGHGMLVWHISYEADRWEYNQVNTVDDYQCIDIEEADNIHSEDSRAGDAFPGTGGITEFTDDTTPGMLTLTGQKRCETPITEIEERNGRIHFKVKGGRNVLPAVEALPATEVTPLSFVANWEAGAEATGYKLDVWKQDGSNIDYVEGYRALPVTGTSCKVKGLTPETTYRYSVRATDKDGESPASNQVEVTTGVATFEYIAPTVTEATGITSSGFTANWLQLEGADGYTLSVYTKEKGTADTLKVDFTGGVKQLPEGWRTDCQMILATPGYYGQAAPSLSMPTDYNYVESPLLNENVRGVKFWYRERNNPSGENRIEVLVQSGTAWTVAETIDLPLPAAKGTTVIVGEDKIPAGCKAVRIVYRKNGSGALAIDDIAVAYNDHLQTVVLPGWESFDAGNATSARVDNLKPQTDYFYTVCGRAGNITTVPSAEMRATTTDATSISSPTEDGVQVSRSGNRLTITCPEMQSVPVELYTTGGQLMGRKAAHRNASASFTLPGNGIYIVKVGSKAFKVVF